MEKKADAEATKLRAWLQDFFHRLILTPPDHIPFLQIRLVRSAVSLTLACCYTMWAVVYLAQLHPLIREYNYGFYQPIFFKDGMVHRETVASSQV
jgi:ATP synthase subunit H